MELKVQLKGPCQAGVSWMNSVGLLIILLLPEWSAIGQE